MNTIEYFNQIVALLTVLSGLISWIYQRKKQKIKKFSLTQEFNKTSARNFYTRLGELIFYVILGIIAIYYFNNKKETFRAVVSIITTASVILYSVHTLSMLFSGRKVTKQKIKRYLISSTIYVDLIFATLAISLLFDLVTVETPGTAIEISLQFLTIFFVFIFLLALQYMYMKGVNDTILHLTRQLNYFIVHYENEDESIYCNDIVDFENHYLVEIDQHIDRNSPPVTTDIIMIDKSKINKIEYIKTLY